MRRLVRYLVKRPRLVFFYDLQDEIMTITVYADANWAGCKVTRKSTSGGCVMRGNHLLRCWSKTQATIAQSSAESELLGAVRGGVEALGAITLLADMGLTCEVSLVLDASAALGSFSDEESGGSGTWMSALYGFRRRKHKGGSPCARLMGRRTQQTSERSIWERT